jgi:hypothetical protein
MHFRRKDSAHRSGLSLRRPSLPSGRQKRQEPTWTAGVVHGAGLGVCGGGLNVCGLQGWGLTAGRPESGGAASGEQDRLPHSREHRTLSSAQPRRRQIHSTRRVDSDWDGRTGTGGLGRTRARDSPSTTPRTDAKGRNTPPPPTPAAAAAAASARLGRMEATAMATASTAAMVVVELRPSGKRPEVDPTSSRGWGGGGGAREGGNRLMAVAGEAEAGRWRQRVG